MRGFEETNEVKVARFSKTEYHSIYSMYRYVRYSTYSRTGVVDDDTWLFFWSFFPCLERFPILPVGA